ncbi:MULTISPECIES: transcription termination/antitermination protein NusG [Cysteiniphilum]|uniref:Transcription termination/antitermination protein NusG n=1 Tax=Cysteiniphilum litorale TaxID=2056700 RepID=A0A8J2Z617_9GAMM|nr:MULTISPECIES: transcription termination/antitermination protein NusG [Cysteiniphilum]GGG04203.1 transcription termination/antitermination protein NusG [Cysteiniphilum litorale]
MSADEKDVPNEHVETEAAQSDAQAESGGKKRWYVIQAYSGYEKRVKTQIEEKIKLEGLEHFFGKILVPTEEVVEMKAGQKRKSERKFFPGYVLIQMEMDEAAWQLVRRIPRVSGFVGGTSERPMPITNAEAERILGSLKTGADKTAPKPRTTFQVGQVVRVLDGPFADFTGVVEEINYEKSRVHVAVSIFGRSTPVELEFSQVEKDA